MALWFAALLGLVQGLTEFIPVSSTAHLRIVPALLGMPDAGAAFSAVIQLGTLVALLIYFAKDIFIEMPRAMFRGGDTPHEKAMAKMPWYLFVATLPVVALGLSLKDYIVGDVRSLYVVSTLLIVVGIVMMFSDRVRGEKTLAEMTLPLAVLIGFAQAAALVPGVSRSGATIVCAIFLGFRPETAARFSFYLGIPAIGGAGLFELKDAIDHLGDGAFAAIALGTAVSAVSGYACIAWLLRYLAKGRLWPFGGYRVLLGGAIVILCLTGVLSAAAG